MTNEEKSFGKRFVSFFVNEELIETSQQSKPAVKQTTTGSSITEPVAVPESTGVVDKKFVEHFNALMEKANQPGPDYYEFMQAVKNMSNLGLPEEKVYQAAWASYKAMGGNADPKALAASAVQYVQVLEEDKKAFAQTVETAIDKKVNTLKQELQRMEEENKAAAEQILTLQEQITHNKEKAAQINGEISEQSIKINNNRSNYEVTHTGFTASIQNDINKISSYLS